MQGPHQVAKKSTNTGWSLLMSSLNETFFSMIELFGVCGVLIAYKTLGDCDADQTQQQKPGSSVHEQIEPVHELHAACASEHPAQLPKNMRFREERSQANGEACENYKLPVVMHDTACFDSIAKIRTVEAAGQ